MKSLSDLLDEMMQAISAHHDAIIAHINSLPNSIKMDIVKEIAAMAVNDISAHELAKEAAAVAAPVVAAVNNAS